jgi:hypothetical protein
MTPEDLVYQLRAIARTLPDSVSKETCAAIEQAADYIEQHGDDSELSKFLNEMYSAQVSDPELDRIIEENIEDLYER